jgi:ethanolamine permease
MAIDGPVVGAEGADARGGTEFHRESGSYLEKRTLRRGSAGWVLLAGLGVAYVISGDYAGWNSGLAEGGFGGLLVAAVVIAAMYFALYSRPWLVANSPDEEFAVLAKAEADLT